MHASHGFLPELLAPAGGPEALRAAIANGADAIYLGVESLNARRGAHNFVLATLPETCRFAHLRGVQVYLTLNVLILPGELDEALRLADLAWAAGVDAIIVQDLGLLRVMRRVLPEVRVHASTQMNTHNTPAIELLESLGVSRVTLAREVSSAEIKQFTSATGIEIECFVHGALCVCHSGQCLMSSLIGGRSANRGLCAQPCRLPYELVDAEHAARETPGAHLLSPKDLAGLAILPQLVATGVSALKIEGRMKSPEYVALVTGVYRAALDRIRTDTSSFEVREGERSVLAESFSRGFTEAYLLGQRGNEMMSYQRPNNRGVFVGRVQSVREGRAFITLDSSLESADTIEFWTSSGRFAQAAGRLIVNGSEAESAPAGSQVELQLMGAASSDDRVFRVRNAALMEAAARTFGDAVGHKQITLSVDVRVVVGEPLRMKVCDADGRSGTAEGSPVESARTKAVTAEEITEHVGRLGGTPYAVASWSLDLSPQAGVGFSALHHLRRAALADYEDAVLAPWAHRRARNPVLPTAPTGKSPTAPTAKTRVRAVPDLVVHVADLASATACLAEGAARALVPVAELQGVGGLPVGIVPLLPRIAHDHEIPPMMRWITKGRRIAIGNAGLLLAATRVGAVVECDWPLNVVNSQSVALLAELGAAFVWLSPELSGNQIAEVAGSSALDVGVSVFGRQELMVTEHCILMAEGPCAQQCRTCVRRSQQRFLRDRKGYEFPVVTDESGRSHVFNSVPLDLAGAIHDVRAAGVSAVKLDLGLYTPDEAASHTAGFLKTLEQLDTDTAPSPRGRRIGTTSGHYFRGVL